MSIAPVEGFRLQEVGSRELVRRRTRKCVPATPKSDEAEEAEQPVSGALPKQKTTVAKKVPVTYELPEDVVEVHQDPEVKDQIIIQYLDHAKNVILQVPSDQELSVERGIAEETQEAAKQRARKATAAAGSEGGETHGD